METRVALMSPTKLAFMPHLLEIYDFTLFIEPATLGFSMAKPTLKPRWQSLYYPLRAEVWVSILALLLLVPIVLLLVSHSHLSYHVLYTYGTSIIILLYTRFYNVV